MKHIKDKIYGIDIDGVCVDFVGAFSRFLKNNLNVWYEDDDIKDYHWYNCDLGITKEDFDREFDNFGLNKEEYRLLSPILGARNAIQFLVRNAKDVWFITGRPHYAYEQTVDSLLNLFNIESDRIIFSSGKDYKSNVVNRLGVDVFIDDAPHYALSLANNTKAKVYLMDATYNKELNHSRITRVDSWREFVTKEIQEGATENYA